MEFQISGVVINPLYLVGIGFLVGILGGFFGVGGGFLAGPLLLWTGVPANLVVGTDLAQCCDIAAEFRQADARVRGAPPAVHLGLIAQDELAPLGPFVDGLGYHVSYEDPQTDYIGHWR